MLFLNFNHPQAQTANPSSPRPKDPFSSHHVLRSRRYAPDDAKHCFFHTRGFEMFEAARTHGGNADLARIFMSCNKEPSKIMHIGTNPLSARNARTKISY
ncbi:unnamed protein product [Durusdinium trenchii]|uniref:Uncharacterized protein n=1 Tax=Durusdinium trenchii TaxID=1381693 RepID=A0ABP0MZ46_9DINO